MVLNGINSSPNDEFLYWSKLKAYAADKINATANLKFVLGRVENIVGKGENAGYQHLVIFPQCFLNTSSSLKVGIVWKRVKLLASMCHKGDFRGDGRSR